MSKTKIIYKDIAPGADEDAVVSSSATVGDSQTALLPTGIHPQEVISLEQNAWVLNGAFVPRAIETLAFWSAQMCGEDCAFGSAPQIMLTTQQQYSSVGVSFEFGGDSWPTSLNIKWYQGNALLHDEDFTPDSTDYFCEAQVEAYNKIVVTVTKMSLPRRRLKVNHIVFGLYRTFGMTELRSASITHEVGLISQEIPISKLNWKLESNRNTAFMFQLKQPVEAWTDNTLIGCFYIDSFTRKSKSVYEILCHDAFGVLDQNPFPGNVYNAVSAKAILQEIIGNDFKIVYDGVSDMNMTGIIQAGSKRAAIQQLAFAWGVCVSTDGRQSIRVFNLPSTPAKIGPERTFNGVSVETASITTKVVVTAHSYAESANGSITIGNKKYADTQTTYEVANTSVTANDKQNIITVSDATLVSPGIAQTVAQRVYDYYLWRSTTSAKVVWKGERLGDCVQVTNAWDKWQTGNISRMEIKLSNTVVANAEVIGV